MHPKPAQELPAQAAASADTAAMHGTNSGRQYSPDSGGNTAILRPGLVREHLTSTDPRVKARPRNLMAGLNGQRQTNCQEAARAVLGSRCFSLSRNRGGTEIASGESPSQRGRFSPIQHSKVKKGN